MNTVTRSAPASTNSSSAARLQRFLRILLLRGDRALLTPGDPQSPAFRRHQRGGAVAPPAAALPCAGQAVARSRLARSDRPHPQRAARPSCCLVRPGAAGPQRAAGLWFAGLPVDLRRDDLREAFVYGLIWFSGLAGILLGLW